MDYEEERRKILLAVADGTMTPGDAAERLAVLEEAKETDPAPRGGSWPGSGASDAAKRIIKKRVRRDFADDEDFAGDEPITELRRIVVNGSLRTVEITGDPSVNEAVADGPHEAFRRGDALVIETENPDWSWDSWSDEAREGGFRFSRGGGRNVVINMRRKLPLPPVKVRMNPTLALDVEIQAGSMTVRDVKGPITAEVDAGALRIRNFAGPISIEVNAGSFTGNGVMKQGASHIECNAGKVDLVLDEGTRVRVSGRAELGKIVMPRTGDEGGVVITKRTSEGGTPGEAELVVGVSLGAATVRRAHDVA
jgi:hypothetical protein